MNSTKVKHLNMPPNHKHSTSTYICTRLFISGTLWTVMFTVLVLGYSTLLHVLQEESYQRLSRCVNRPITTVCLTFTMYINLYGKSIGGDSCHFHISSISVNYFQCYMFVDIDIYFYSGVHNGPFLCTNRAKCIQYGTALVCFKYI